MLSHVASTAEGAERYWGTSFVRDASGAPREPAPRCRGSSTLRANSTH